MVGRPVGVTTRIDQRTQREGLGAADEAALVEGGMTAEFFLERQRELRGGGALAGGSSLDLRL